VYTAFDFNACLSLTLTVYMMQNNCGAFRRSTFFKQQFTPGITQKAIYLRSELFHYEIFSADSHSWIEKLSNKYLAK
jgi:hypothetical protein